MVGLACAACGKAPLEAIRHDFFEGTPERPVKKWSVTASLYYLSSQDGRFAEANFCGPECAAMYFRDRFGRALTPLQ